MFCDYRVKSYVAGGGDTPATLVETTLVKTDFSHEHDIKMGMVVPDSLF
jgi:hypothetical protein